MEKPGRTDGTKKFTFSDVTRKWMVEFDRVILRLIEFLRRGTGSRYLIKCEKFTMVHTTMLESLSMKF